MKNIEMKLKKIIKELNRIEAKISKSPLSFFDKTGEKSISVQKELYMIGKRMIQAGKIKELVQAMTDENEKQRK